MDVDEFCYSDMDLAIPLSGGLVSVVRRDREPALHMLRHGEWPDDRHAASRRGIHAGFSLASGRASHFLLRGQEKVTKEKATPRTRLTHSPCAPGARACSGVV